MKLFESTSSKPLKVYLQRCLRNHQTRKQLSKLPAHLYGDIGKNSQQIHTEVKKCALISQFIAIWLRG